MTPRGEEAGSPRETREMLRPSSHLHIQCWDECLVNTQWRRRMFSSVDAQDKDLHVYSELPVLGVKHFWPSRPS